MTSNRVAWLSPNDPPHAFPDINTAMQEPDGLLAAGGDLGSERLLYAYSHGIFPWFDDGQPILWWSPNPRCILRVDDFHTSSRMRALREAIRDLPRSPSIQNFAGVIRRLCRCAHGLQHGTWITARHGRQAFVELHAAGMGPFCRGPRGRIGARRRNLWVELLGALFFGESMFSHRRQCIQIRDDRS